MTTSIVQNVATAMGDAVTYTTNSTSGAAINSIWVGTQAQYDAIAVKDANTQYNIVAA